MQRYNVFYGVYNHGTLDVIVQNVQKTHERISAPGSERMQRFRSARKCR